jgi:type II secretory ATPase GspE/PulE/Tfp pilus assembly ATPase PilB-like protein
VKIAPDKTSFKTLLSSGAVPKEALEKAFREAEQNSSPFLKVVVDSGLLREEEVLNIFSKSTGRPVVNLKSTPPDPAVFQHVPVKFASYYKFFPIHQKNGKLLIAVPKIPDIHTLDEMRFALGADIELCFASEKDIEEMTMKYYGLAAETVEKILAGTPASERPMATAPTQEVEDIEKLASTASVSHVVNQIILDAYKKRASDIHLEPLTSGIRLRYRIDGILQQAPVPREMKDFFSPMLSRIKIMTNLNVAEKRLPQDGKMRVKTQDETLDLRVSFIPTAHGESLVIRILPGKNVFKLEKLGFSAKQQAVFEELLDRPNGIVFVTGPTGSGKSTTLYAALNRLNVPTRKIITIEDPVEYELEGISQIHVNPEIGLTFSNGLRSMLRQDPDVMMVGEVRDLETAEIAIQSALTGHLILSTLHTNDAASGVTRLLDIGVEPYLIASSVVAFMAQRLVRVICPDCKEENVHVSPEIKALIEKENGTSQRDIRLFHGRGCEQCNGTGYRGRVAIQELLILTESLRKLIMARATAETIKAQAIKQGMITLRRDGWAKALAGVTTPEEILEVTEHEAFSFPKETPTIPASEIPELPVSSPPIQETVIKKMPESAGVAEKIEARAEAPTAGSQKTSPGMAPSDHDFVNMRKYKRIQFEAPVFFRVVESHGKSPVVQKNKEKLSEIELEGSTENISAGGILLKILDQTLPMGAVPGAVLTIGEILEAGSVLFLKIKLSDGEKSVECMAKALRVIRSGLQGEHLAVATLFLVINSIDRTRLEKFCQAHQASDEKV